MRRVIVPSALAALLATGFANPALGADPKEALARARTLYNERKFESAITAAEEGRLSPEHTDSADRSWRAHTRALPRERIRRRSRPTRAIGCDCSIRSARPASDGVRRRSRGHAVL
jgi:hypothetical protein